MKYTIYLVLMVISEIFVLTMFGLISNSKKSKKSGQLRGVMQLLLIAIFIWTFSLIMQILFQNTNVPLTFFEGMASFGACFLPIFVLFLGIIFCKTRIKIRWYYVFLLIIPILSTILMFTNDTHHLMYIEYSVYLEKTLFGEYFIVHSIFSYACIFIGIAYLLFFSIKNSGIFSKQSLIIIVGTLVPTIVNVVGTLGLADFTVYVTPISFTFAIMCFALAIFKFDFLSVTPIALQKIVNQISDGYIVLSDNGTVSDFNKTFLDLFGIKDEDIRSKDFIEYLKSVSISDEGINRIKHAIFKVNKTNNSISFEQKINFINKYFRIEISPISSEGASLGTLILLKDITQHKNDMETIKNNQNILMERERLASLGQLIGGIAHNLKTPIMSISGAVEGLENLIKEYDESIDDPLVNSKDHHEIAKDMESWIPKIRAHIEYMSDIITTVKGQAVALASQEDIFFTVGELVKKVNILMKHELKNSYTYLNVLMKIDENLTLSGDVNSLVQVINNMISNSIQAYNGEKNKNIELEVNQKGNNIIFSIKDFAGGLPKEVQEKLFKEMVTTKGKNGTGLGLYMSYSNIRAHFRGDITYKTEDGKGTTFNIIIPTRN